MASAAKLRSVSLSSDQDWNAPRWMFEAKTKVKGPQVVRQLVELRREEMAKNFSRCLTLSRQLAPSAPGLRMWLAAAELDCATQAARASGGQIADLTSALGKIDKNPNWLLVGGAKRVLKALYLEGMVVKFELQSRSERRAAWVTYDQLTNWKDSLSKDQLARTFRSAGELAFVEQNLTMTIDFFSRSLDEKESQELRRRLVSIRSNIVGKKDESKEEVAEPTGTPEANGEEMEIVSRMQVAIKSGDLLPAIEDGMRLIEKFPGSQSAKWASDRVLEIYLSLGAKSDGEYPTLRKRAVEIMVRGDAARVYRWANNAYVKGFYSDAQRLAETSANKYGGQPDSTKALVLAGNSAFYSGDQSGAAKWFERLVNEHNGTDDSRQALFRLGLMRFREKKWGECSAYMERLLALAPNTDWEYMALHWQWRAQQKLNLEASQKIATRLVERYPLTYYGLRAQAELNGGWIKTNEKKTAALKSDMWVSESQGQAWERVQLLLRAGWFEEAQAEIGELPEPLSAEDRVVRARLLAAAFDHYSAIKSLNDVWTERPDLFQWSLARSAFPLEYSTSIDKESGSNDLDPDLVRGLIRQESSFKSSALSTSNAYGVMQILPATAQEVAGTKWRPALVLPDDLFNPEVNIRIGSIYLARMIRAFKGNVPLALAAYNAGIGRMRKWIASRPDLGDIESRTTSAPEDEIWIDELPWAETSFYVKAILRNLMVYEVLKSGEFKLPDPVWARAIP